MLIAINEIREHLRLDDDSHDAELRAMYAAALDYCEQYLERDIPWDTDTESQVFPGGVKYAMLMIIGDLFENREAATAGVKIESNPTVDRLLTFHRDEMGV